MCVKLSVRHRDVCTDAISENGDIDGLGSSDAKGEVL